jgi:hypothetical protein
MEEIMHVTVKRLNAHVDECILSIAKDARRINTQNITKNITLSSN